MICEKYFDLIEDSLEDELDAYLSERAQSHIFACQACRSRYETLRRAKEIYGQYLFDAEPPPDSWANFEARLLSAGEKVKGDSFTTANWLRHRKRMFVFRFFPASAAAAFAALFFICGLGFVWLQTGSVERDSDKFVAEKDRGNSPAPTKSQETDQRPTTGLRAVTLAVATDDGSKNKDLIAKSKSLKASGDSPSGKKSFAAETVKINQKTASPTEPRKPASQRRPTEETRLQALQMQNLEIEIAGQMEKVELLLRSFRNARSNEGIEGIDVEYEKRQARKLLDKNALLKRSAESYGLAYAEELLSRVEPYLLDIANLETNPSTDKVLDIRNRVGSQNIIASLQVYSRDESQ